MTSIRMKSINSLEAGDRFRVARTFTEQDVAGFAAASRDYNPVHFDERFAAAKGFKGRICHGLLVGSLLTEIGGQLGLLAAEMTFSFRKPVYFEETITCEWTITQIDARGGVQANVVFTNADNAVVLESSVKGILPGEREREIMNAMVEEGDPTNPIGKETERK